MSKDKPVQEEPDKSPVSKRKTKKQNDLEDQIQQLTEDVKRERADFMNYKRRSEMDRIQIMQLAKSDVVMQLLPLFDDLERALGAMPADIADNPWAKGVAQVHRQVQAKLSELGITRIECLGAKFDPELHEAVGFDDGAEGEEMVTEELRPGYRMDETVLRPSMVKVGKVNDDNATKKENNNG